MKTDLSEKKIQDRIKELKQENDRSLLHIQALEAERQKTVNDILTRNGRILELEETFKEKKIDT